MASNSLPMIRKAANWEPRSAGDWERKEENRAMWRVGEETEVAHVGERRSECNAGDHGTMGVKCAGRASLSRSSRGIQSGQAQLRGPA